MQWRKWLPKNLQQAAREVFTPTVGIKSMSENHDRGHEDDLWDEGNQNVALRATDAQGASSSAVAQKVAAPLVVPQQGTSDYCRTAIEKRETTVITEGTRIRGSVTSDADIAIAGEIQGSVESKNAIVVTGKVDGDITCGDLEIHGASIEGNLASRGALTVTKGSVVVGNLLANNSSIDGAVRGNLAIELEVEIRKDAQIIGDITASSISVERGAVLRGSVKIPREEP